MGSGRKHLAFLKSQINIMSSEKAFHNTTLMCRNGVFSLNSLLTFLLFKDELTSIEHWEEDLVVLLPDVDVEVIRDNLDTLLAGPGVVGGISSFSLLLPYQSSVQPVGDEKRGRRSVNRTGHVCKVCGKYLKRTRWEAGAHDLLHRAMPDVSLVRDKTVCGCKSNSEDHLVARFLRTGSLSCLVPSGFF